MKYLFFIRIGFLVLTAGIGAQVAGAGENDQHWSFAQLPLMRGLALPAGSESGTPIDHYVRRALAAEGLTPAKPAAAHRQIRRLSLMLTGIPPEPGVVRAFVKDPTSAHYERLVDRYLQSPAFGERWARHWMDVVRYAETWGYEWNHLIREAWRFRDYLIRAFNQDLPFDQFVREHIAGDLLAEPRRNEFLGINESLIGGAFYRFGETGHDDCVLYPEISLDVMDNQIDTLSKSFQALTVSCARCHDHKLDDIPQSDYYALLGVLASSRQVIRTLNLPHRQDDLKERMAELKEHIRDELGGIWERKIAVLSVESIDAMAKALDEQGTAWNQMEHPLYAWYRMTRSPEESNWPEIGSAVREEQERRLEFNAKHFVVLGDFTSEKRDNAGWDLEGLAVPEGFVSHGDFAVVPAGDDVLDGLLRAGFYTHTLSQKLNAALRSPLLPEDKKFVSYESMGERNSVCRTVIANCTLPYFHTNRFSSPKLSWTQLGLEHLRTSPLVPLRTYLEWATVLDDQGYPILNLPQAEYHKTLADPRSYFGVTKVVAHDVQETPREELQAQLLVFETPISSAEDLVCRYRELLARAIAHWVKGQAKETDVFWINAFIGLEFFPRRHNASDRLNGLVTAYRALEDRLEAPKRIAGMADQGGFDVPLFRAGEVSAPGNPVPRGYLSAIERRINNAPVVSGSGRERVAELIANAENPLTARVLVNRLWHHLFGHGLVRSVDDFGKLGEEPSHPLLLDYLARRLIDSGWSMKLVIREIVLSETFRQTSVLTEEADQVDPENRLLHRYPSRRLEAEVLRDSMLWASDRLDPAMFGPSTNPYREADVDRRKLYAGALDGEGRRSLYLKVTRMGPPKLLELFNFPDPSMTRGRRDSTNVPSQALGMFNHPFVHQQAERHAGRVVEAAGEETFDTLLENLYLRLLSRSPCEDELGDGLEFFHELAGLHGLEPAGALGSVAVWKDFIHMLYNLKEFTYVL